MVKHSGMNEHAPEEIDQIEQLVDALRGSRHSITRTDGLQEGVLDEKNSW